MGEGSYITAITPTKRDPKRLSVKVDGHFVAALASKSIDRLGLAPGQPWDEALAARVEQAAAHDKAMDDAMRRIGRRAMSRFEMERKLEQRGHDEAVRAAVLDRLTELELLDDEAFGRSLIRDLTACKPAGPKLLMQKLRQKGLDPKLAQRLVDEAMESSPQVDEALAFARKRLGAMGQLEARTRQRRLHGQLARRGFERETIEQVMEALRDELTDPEEPGPQGNLT